MTEIDPHNIIHRSFNMLAIAPLKFTHDSLPGIPQPHEHQFNGRETHTRRQNFQGLRVGIIDDQSVVIMAISALCRRTLPGAHVVTLKEEGQDLSSILQWVEDEKINVLIVDFNLTGERLGSQIVEALRNAEKNIAIIGHTACRDNTNSFQKSGTDTVLLKPANAEVLTDAVIDACVRHGI